MNLHVSNVERQPRASRRRKRFLSSIALPRIKLGRRKAAGTGAARRLGTPGAAAVWLPAGVRVVQAVRSARAISLLLLLACLGSFAGLLNDGRFYVTRPEVTGRQTIPAKDVYALTGVLGLHLFWVDPAALETALEASPSIAEAHVTIGWPDRVRIAIVERTAVAVWQQAGAVQWVAADGRLMPARGEQGTVASQLLRIVVTSGRPLPADAVSVNADTVQAALTLRGMRPNIASLNYYERGGLEYDDGRGWQAFFGTGDDMALKLAVYETLVDYLLHERGLQPQEIAYIVVTDVQHPFYSLRGEPDIE